MKASILAASLLVAGCVQVATKAVLQAGGVEASRYIYIGDYSEESYQAYLDQLKPTSGKVGADGNGSWYHELDDRKYYFCLLTKNEEAPIRQALMKGVGILQPVYVISKNGDIEPDWKATERAHALLRSKLHLRLAPLSATRTYHALAMPFIAERARAAAAEPVSFANVSERIATTAKMSPFNAGRDYYDAIISRLGHDASYVIGTSDEFLQRYATIKMMSNSLDNTTAFMEKNFSTPEGRKVLRDMRRSADDVMNEVRNGHLQVQFGELAALASATRANKYLAFTTTESIRQTTEGGYAFLRTGCVENDIAAKKSEFAAIHAKIGVGAGLSYALKNANTTSGQRMDAARTEALSEIRAAQESNIAGMDDLVVKTAKAFETYKIAGAIQSRSLDDYGAQEPNAAEQGAEKPVTAKKRSGKKPRKAAD